ncbi:hypothetical protein CRI94_02450 [Longibacter salinarum]|uniref:Penicillin acylase family protein n=1 Tax=Longibacter salinarum TaxID=1850348 RepID=A0A2A8D2R7_9BACT|nr:penicillin acylase family protein [Longibacter salinarum]PEN15164.1 hypothetical protein CRI94_02450 [Longibacter salinarum]
MTTSRLVKLLSAAVLAALLLYMGNVGIGAVPPLEILFDPADGLHRTARNAHPAANEQTLTIDALDQPVTVVRDERYVPHIYAKSDRDAIIALGYLVATDRLFQLDFVPRVAAGKLSEAFGEGSIETDQFLRSTGMDWGARRNLRRIREEGGIEDSLVSWYAAGVQAHMNRLEPEDLPLEFRLLGYEPAPFDGLQAMRVLQYMTYDLTYSSDDGRYAALQTKLDSTWYDRLYPKDPAGLYVPIIPSSDAEAGGSVDRRTVTAISAERDAAAGSILAQRHRRRANLRGTLAEGYIPSKGSNNWAVSGTRATTGAPILAGDMHLGLSLPPIWYEAHLVTPTMNAHGLTVPGAPALVQAITPDHGWAFTNTGSDQIDHYSMEVRDDRSAYRFEGEWRSLRTEIDTIRVKDSDPVIDTLYYSHWGPVHFADTSDAPAGGLADGRLAAVAEQWVAHKPSTTLKALWGMVHADSLGDFEAALRDWDTPMQNVLYAGRDGHIAIRSTGHMPVRRQGHGRGLLDGTSNAGEWTSRIPFQELPYSRDPNQGYLFSANQKPTDDTYPHYLNHDWRDGWRSLRIDSLLAAQRTHSFLDLQSYQADVDVQQRDAFLPLIQSISDLPPEADSLRRMLAQWDGVAALDRPEPLILDVFLSELRRMVWDEDVFTGENRPEDAVLLDLANANPNAQWFDVTETAEEETAQEVARRAFVTASDSLYDRHGAEPQDWRWGDHHAVIFRHLTRSEQLKPLWRGPMPYPGFDATVSPARGREATHSASQRFVIDFSVDPPRAVAVVPGGQSGNPLHPRFYDDQLDEYVNFEYFPVRFPASPSDLPDSLITGRSSLQPSTR